MKPKPNSSRAQAALEFLMTYGWAILIMLVVIALLFFLGVFNSSTSVPSSCVLPAGFTCKEFSLDSSGRLYLDLGQATGKTVTVNGVGCGPVAGSVSSLPIPVSILSGDHAVISDLDVACAGNYSNAFKGKISIRYQPSGASYNKTITGDLSAPVAVVSAGEQGQWNTSYGYYRQVTVNTGVSSNLTNFPAYFVLDTQHLIAYGRMNSTCKDLRVVNSTKDGVMDYEIENNTCNTTNTVVWFRIPQTNAANDYTAYAFYGNNSAADAQNKAGVWQNGFVAVYHLGDTSDSTGANNAVNNGATSTPAKIGNGMYFSGASAYINCGTGSAFNFGSGDFTFAAWIKTDSYSFLNGLVSHGGVEWDPGFYVRQTSDSAYQFLVNTGGSTYQGAGTGPAFGIGTWYHGAFQKSGNNLTTYANGARGTADKGAQAWNSSSTSSLLLGSVHGRLFNGTLDEVRVSNVARSQDWVRAEYGQSYSVGSEQVN